MNQLQVELLDNEIDKWDSFILNHPNANFFHQTGWKNVVERTYHHKPFYIMVKDNNTIKGVLPLFLMRHVLFGRFLVSVPFGDYGGVCAESVEASNVLLDKAISIVKMTKAKFLELRHTLPVHSEELALKTNRYNLVLQLDQDPELVWKSFRPEVRNQVRKAKKSNLKAIVGKIELVRDFYSVFARNMRDLGTPVHHFNFFRNILAEFRKSVEIILIRLDNITVGGGIVTYFKDTLEIPWASSLRDFLHLCPNNLLYWSAIERGCLMGYKWFSFGRSPWGSGTFRFKKQWGAKPSQLYYQYYLPNGGNLPDYTPSTNPKFNLAVNIWKRLPMGLTEILGPMIISGIPY